MCNIRCFRGGVTVIVMGLLAACEPIGVEEQREAEPGPRSQPGTEMGLYTPEQHPAYDGRFVVSGARVFQAGSLDDASPWDHMGDAADNVHAVGGRVDIDVNEIDNSGSFRAELELPQGSYVMELEEFVEFSPCHDGGIAAYLFEHGDAGCGDANWPKSVLFVAGWGLGSATLNGETLYEDYHPRHGHSGHA